MNTPDTEHQKLNPRVARALGVDSVPQVIFSDADMARLPPRPDPATPDSVCNWIREVIPLMYPDSPYRKKLVDVIHRYELVEQRATTEVR